MNFILHDTIKEYGKLVAHPLAFTHCAPAHLLTRFQVPLQELGLNGSCAATGQNCGGCGQSARPGNEPFGTGDSE
jgi:hypothetical protein